MPGEHIAKALRLEYPEHFSQTGQERHPCRVRSLILLLRITFLFEIEIEGRIFRLIRQTPGFVAYTDKGQTRRKHQGLLRAGNHNVNPPFIGFQVEHAQCRNGVHNENRLIP